MKVAMSIVTLVAVYCSDARAQFELALISADVSATSQISVASTGESIQGSSGGPFASFYNGLNVGFSSESPFGMSFAYASASQDTTFTPTTISSSGSVGTDVDDNDEGLTAGTGIANSSLTVEFVLEEQRRWSFDDLSLGGTHAGAGATLFPTGNPKTPVFSFDSFSNTYDGESGLIGPGSFTFTVYASASTNLNDGFNGLFASASYSLLFRLSSPTPTPCPGDADQSGSVNFADITAVLVNFNVSYAPDSGPGDADQSGLVNFADITAVLINFGATCP